MKGIAEADQNMLQKSLNFIFLPLQNCIKFMIFGQLPGRSPQGKGRSLIKSINQTPLFHMNCLQLSKIRLHYDDTVYQHSNVSKIVLMCRIVQVEKATSARGLPMLNMRVQDCTGKCLISFYHSEEIQAICSNVRGYVKIGVNVKCAGMVYKPEIKFIGASIVELSDYNELTAHFLQCIRTAIKTQ